MLRKLKWLAIVLVLLVAGTGSVYAYSVYKSVSGFNKEATGNSRFEGVKKIQTTSTDIEPPKWEGKSRVNILILGGDSRGLKTNEIPRSDSMMIASIDPVTKKTALFSVLRDTYTKIPGYGSDRINAALAYGGPNLAMKTISDLLGIPIQYYVYTDFQGFIGIIDAIGGIDIDVEKDMKYSDAADGHEFDIDLKKGYQHMDGKTALQYVRFRHDATSDFTRTERQRKFMTAVADKMQSTTSLIKLPRILQAMDPYIETNLTVAEMIKLAALGYEAKTSGIVSQQIPPDDLLVEKTIKGSEVITTDPEKVKAFVRDELSGIQPYTSSSPSTGSKKSEAANVTSTKKPSSKSSE